MIRIEGEERPMLRSIEAPKRPLVIGDEIRVEWYGTWPVYQIICHEDDTLIVRRVDTNRESGVT